MKKQPKWQELLLICLKRRTDNTANDAIGIARKYFESPVKEDS